MFQIFSKISLTLVNWTKMPTSSPQLGMAKFGEGQDGKTARRQDGE
jgi:hypothetical protein